jgi:hypothetical protein
MPIQFIGMIRTDNKSEIDSAFVAEFARAHEEGEHLQRQGV